MQTDAQLIRAARHGADAFGELYRRHADVRATDNATGRPSTFMVEHDAGLDRYQAFLLHERTVHAAGAGAETGAVCTAAELTRAERVALGALRTRLRPSRTHLQAPSAAVSTTRSSGPSRSTAVTNRPRC